MCSLLVVSKNKSKQTCFRVGDDKWAECNEPNYSNSFLTSYSAKHTTYCYDQAGSCQSKVVPVYKCINVLIITTPLQVMMYLAECRSVSWNVWPTLVHQSVHVVRALVGLAQTTFPLNKLKHLQQQEQQRVAVGPGKTQFISIHQESSDAATLRCGWCGQCCMVHH